MKPENPFFTVTVPPAPEILHPVLTRDMAGNGRIHAEDLALRVHSAKVAAADELYSALKNAVEETCRWCLEAHDIDTRHAGDFCPFSQKEPCIVQKWKDTLKRAGKEPMNYYVKLTKLNRRRK